MTNPIVSEADLISRVDELIARLDRSRTSLGVDARLLQEIAHNFVNAWWAEIKPILTAAAQARSENTTAQEGNIGPCRSFVPGADPSRCMYCDHKIERHSAVAAAPSLSRDGVEEVVKAATELLKIEKSLKTDLISCHALRGDAASDWMREDDKDLRREFAKVCDDFRTALQSLAKAKGEAL